MRQLRGRTLRLAKVGCGIFVIIILIWYITLALKKRVTPLYASGVVKTTVGDIQYDFSTGMFAMVENNNNYYLQGLLSETLRSTAALECKADQNNPSYLCLHWVRYAKLEVKKLPGHDGCHEISWKPTSRDFLPHECVSLRGAVWYGGGEMYVQRWPLQNVTLPLQPYLPNDLQHKSKLHKQGLNTVGNVVERFWFNSKGVGLVVDSAVPLFVSVNESGSNLLCLSTDTNHPRYAAGQSPFLKYTICKQNNAKEIYRVMQQKHFESPKTKPNLDLMMNPVITTEPRFHGNLTQANVLIFVKKIKDAMDKNVHFDKLYFEFDGNYSSAFGNFDIDSERFRNAHQVVSQMKEYGYKVLFSVTPFINKNSKYFDKNSDLWIQNTDSEQLALVKWYHGFGAILDITHADAVKWFKTKVTEMIKDYRFEGVKLYACETNFLPPNHLSRGYMINPGSYITKFVSMMNNLDIQNQVMQTTCAYKTQKIPAYVQLGNKDSRWGPANGLQSVIPAVMTLGILGYPFVIPGVVGGSNFHGNISGMPSRPDRELFIRWLQVAIFMPVLKFSFVPWDYDDHVVEISLKLLQERLKIMPHLIQAAKEAETNGSPIIRPLWWIDPQDHHALTMDCQFLVGKELMVAPVVYPGVEEIDIYLPRGDWKDGLTGKRYNGRQWLRGYEVKLHQVATFTKHKSLA